MRKSIVLLLLCCGVATAQAPQTTKTAKIEEIFRITKTDQMQKQMISQMSAMMQQQMASHLSPEQLQAATAGAQKSMDFVTEKMSWEAMRAEYIKLYDDTFSEEEISGILMFYQSAPGQAFLAKTPLLMTNIVAMVQKRMTEIKPELDLILKQSGHTPSDR